MSLRSDQCYGTSHWALDEFAQIRERDVDDWCQGVIGATVLSYTQLVLDLTWLGWVVWLARSAGDVVDVQQRQMRGEAVGSGGVGVGGDIEAGGRGSGSGSEGSTLTPDTPHNTSTSGNGNGNPPHRANANTSNDADDSHIPTHAQKVLAALRMPVPLILLKIAAHRSEQEIIRLENIIARNRSRMAQARYAPMRNGERRVEPEGTAHIEAGENVHTAQEVWVHRDQGQDYPLQVQGQGRGQAAVYGGQHGYTGSRGPNGGNDTPLDHSHSTTANAHADGGYHPHPYHPQAHDPHSVQMDRDRDATLGYREVPPPYIGKEGGAPGYVTPGRELDEGVFFGGAGVDGDDQGNGGRGRNGGNGGSDGNGTRTLG